MPKVKRITVILLTKSVELVNEKLPFPMKMFLFSLGAGVSIMSVRV